MTDSHPLTPPSIAGADWLCAPATQRVLTALNQNGYIARAVGGCIRNTLLAMLFADTAATVTDIDIATTAPPDQTIALAEASGLRTVPTGLQHGTVTIIADHQGFEVTTLRRDVATDGRRAEVSFTDDWALDAARRDLTINALYADPDGTIVDPLDGYADLREKRIRFVGDPATRIREDYLRILRFFRFHAEYGSNKPDEAGLHACVVERGGLARLSRERIRQELIKLLIAQRSVETLQLMLEYGLLTEILPVAPNMHRLARMVSHDNNAPDPALRLAALVIHTAEDATRISQTLRLSNSEAKTLTLASHALEMKIDAPPEKRIAGGLLYRQGAGAYRQLIKLLWSLDCTETHGETWAGLLQLPDVWTSPQLPVSGKDILSLGIAPGPEVGTILIELEEIWLKSEFAITRDELLEIAQSKLTKPGH